MKLELIWFAFFKESYSYMDELLFEVQDSELLEKDLLVIIHKIYSKSDYGGIIELERLILETKIHKNLDLMFIAYIFSIYVYFEKGYFRRVRHLIDECKNSIGIDLLQFCGFDASKLGWYSLIKAIEGTILYLQHEYTLGQNYLNEAIRIAKAQENHWFSATVYRCHAIALYYPALSIGKYDSVRYHFEKSNEYYGLIGSISYIASNNIMISICTEKIFTEDLLNYIRILCDRQNIFLIRQSMKLFLDLIPDLSLLTNLFEEKLIEKRCLSEISFIFGQKENIIEYLLQRYQFTLEYGHDLDKFESSLVLYIYTTDDKYLKIASEYNDKNPHSILSHQYYLWQSYSIDNLEEKECLLEKALLGTIEYENERSIANIFTRLGKIKLQTGNIIGAIASFDQVIKIYDTIKFMQAYNYDSPIPLIHALFELGKISYSQDRLKSSISYFTRALLIFNNPYIISNILKSRIIMYLCFACYDLGEIGQLKSNLNELYELSRNNDLIKSMVKMVELSINDHYNVQEFHKYLMDVKDYELKQLIFLNLLYRIIENSASSISQEFEIYFEECISIINQWMEESNSPQFIIEYSILLRRLYLINNQIENADECIKTSMSYAKSQRLKYYIMKLNLEMSEIQNEIINLMSIRDRIKVSKIVYLLRRIKRKTPEFMI